MPDTSAPPCEALPAGDGPAPAATLSAGMVRRGHNPWWGKDQKNPAPAKPRPEGETKPEPPPPAARGNFVRARTLLNREDTPAQNPAPKTDPALPGVRTRLRPPPDANANTGLFERLPVQMLTDFAVFAAVFTVSCGLMLYLSLYAF